MPEGIDDTVVGGWPEFDAGFDGLSCSTDLDLESSADGFDGEGEEEADAACCELDTCPGDGMGIVSDMGGAKVGSDEAGEGE